MGSWSVYCGISQIAITAGQKCVFLPLKKVLYDNSYLPYLPATLPIFGEYDDYGGIENIEKDANTELIEKHFNCTIEEFCHFFTRGCIRDDEDDFPKKLKKVKEIQNWKFMFIDRKVYDFMSTNIQDGFGGKGQLDFGNPAILELIGFKRVGDTTEDDGCRDYKRYNQKWELNGEFFFSDGNWLNHKDGSVYELTGQEYNNLSDYVEIPQDKLWLKDKAMWELWEYLDKNKQAKELYWILGLDRSYWIVKMFRDPDKQDYNGIEYKYAEDVKSFGKGLCDLVTIRHNLHPMSSYFAPFVNYLTPQCGEFDQHQVILDKFAEINKTYIEPEEDE